MLFRSNDTATTEIYTMVDTLSLHDALPIWLDAHSGNSNERGWLAAGIRDAESRLKP